jgi:hypothetical protein
MADQIHVSEMLALVPTRISGSVTEEKINVQWLNEINKIRLKLSLLL